LIVLEEKGVILEHTRDLDFYGARWIVR